MAVAVRTTKVLVVDDSAVICRILKEQLSKHAEIDVIDTAADPLIALEKIVSLKPDVLTLDVEMPRMDGITFLRKLMKHKPMPVIVLSSLTPKGGRTAIEALKAGAIEVMCKPSGSAAVETMCLELAEKIKSFSCVNIKNLTKTRPSSARPSLDAIQTTDKIIAIGASTGGVQTLTQILSSFDAGSPATLVVQHMPQHFTAAFAERLNRECAVTVKEAVDGDEVCAGTVLIAPGGKHMILQKNGARFFVNLNDGPAVYLQKPSVEVLFNSVAKAAGPKAIGVILTGMGKDGSTGLLNMRQKGAHTIAQDQASCVVFGMPKEAIALNAAEKIVPLPEITQTIMNFARLR